MHSYRKYRINLIFLVKISTQKYTKKLKNYGITVLSIYVTDITLFLFVLSANLRYLLRYNWYMELPFAFN